SCSFKNMGLFIAVCRCIQYNHLASIRFSYGDWLLEEILTENSASPPVSAFITNNGGNSEFL
ncbi:MAG TPA: hypothetical protein VN703_01905, partial [Candidatus Sulfopaludibacter sp.]|nr:hypothetical protein [Candidatus Sulfopaludibacter sp.]